jgi:ribose 1,5-bisphosphokinase
MNRRMHPFDTGEPEPARIGPGRLVLVVGPSGAGKDTLIGSARVACRGVSGIVFPRRIITRPSSAAEDHGTISAPAFDQAAAEGAFAIWWSAHGLRYGIPGAIDADLQAGRTVVCNVSRTVVTQVRKRYANVVVVLVTAPPDLLAARLADRARGSDGDVLHRISRAVEADLNADVTIENVGTVERATAEFLNAIGERDRAG